MSARKAAPPKAAPALQLGLFAAPPKPWDAPRPAPKKEAPALWSPAFEAHLETLREETRGAAYEAAELDPRTAPGYTPTAAEAHALRSSVATIKAALLPSRVCLGCGVVLENGAGPLCEKLCGPEDALYTWEERAGIAGVWAATEQLGDRPPRPGR